MPGQRDVSTCTRRGALNNNNTSYSQPNAPDGTGLRAATNASSHEAPPHAAVDGAAAGAEPPPLPAAAAAAAHDASVAWWVLVNDQLLGYEPDGGRRSVHGLGAAR